MKKTKIVSLLVLLAIFAGCNSTGNNEQQSDQDTHTITHRLGTIEVVDRPQRVVVFDIGTLETFDELDIPIVGAPLTFVPEHLKTVMNSSDIEDVGSLKEANYERVNALNPDLIIISARLETAYDEFSKIAPTLFLETDAKDYMKSFKDNTLTVAQLFHKEEQALEKLAVIQENIDNAKETLAKDQHNGLILLYNNGRFSAYGSGSRFGFVHDVLGVKPAVEDLDVAVHGQKVSNEFVLETNPDYLFIIDRNAVVNKVESNKSDIENPLIKETNASKNGKIIYLDPSVWYMSQGGITSTRMMTEEILNAL